VISGLGFEIDPRYTDLSKPRFKINTNATVTKTPWTWTSAAPTHLNFNLSAAKTKNGAEKSELSGSIKAELKTDMAALIRFAANKALKEYRDGDSKGVRDICEELARIKKVEEVVPVVSKAIQLALSELNTQLAEAQKQGNEAKVEELTKIIEAVLATKVTVKRDSSDKFVSLNITMPKPIEFDRKSFIVDVYSNSVESVKLTVADTTCRVSLKFRFWLNNSSIENGVKWANEYLRGLESGDEKAKDDMMENIEGYVWLVKMFLSQNDVD
ncbi:MAG: hypothetical protein AAB116_15075, partial [Candidatus Poribacteria bacterium]